jgi:hypothetical protein
MTEQADILTRFLEWLYTTGIEGQPNAVIEELEGEE